MAAILGAMREPSARDASADCVGVDVQPLDAHCSASAMLRADAQEGGYAMVLDSETPTQAASWRFTKPAVVRTDPLSAEFFAGTDRAGRLIREGIQNSLDQKELSEPGPVRVRIRLIRSSGRVAPQDAAVFLPALEGHLDALEDLEEAVRTDQKVSVNDLLASPMSYLAFEDFGTTGLQGDVEQEQDDRENYFNYFWYNDGRSPKHGNQLGRWGVGKWVFPDLSSVKVVLGMTVRRDDPERPKRSLPPKLLLGRCVLKHHQLEGEEWGPYGFFGAPSSGDGHRPSPLSEAELITNFEKRFDLERGDEPGLSLVVPFPVAKLSCRDLVQKTIEHFAYPILTGELEVEVGDEEGSVSLNSDSLIERASAAFDEPGWDEVFAFLLDCATGPDPETLPIIPAADNPQQHPLGERIQAIGVEVLRAKLAAGELIRLRVPVYVKYRKTTKQQPRAEPTYFDLYLRGDPAEAAARREYYVRGGLTISGIKTDVASYPVVGFVDVGDGPLSELLGDSEGVAHNDWRPYSLEDESKVKFELGPTTIRYVKGALAAVASALLADDSGKVEGALLDLFGIDDPEMPSKQKKAGVVAKPKAKDRTKAPPNPPKPTRPRPFLVTTPKPGEVQITRNKESTDVESYVRVRLAYSLEGGSSIAKHSRFDFDVTSANSPIVTSGERVKEISPTATNEFRLTIDQADPEFRFVAGGFDPHRDLVVDVRYLE